MKMSAHNLLAQLGDIDVGDGTVEWYIGNPDTTGKVIAGSNTVPSDGSYGYGNSCIYLHMDGGDGTALYVNEGTRTSCNFNAILVAA